MSTRFDVGALTPIEQTAFLTLYGRALNSRWPRPILGDTLAAETVSAIDYDFEGIGVVSSVVCQLALRSKMLDERARRFITDHPDAVVVDLGGGLDTAVYRVDPPPQVDWYSVDFQGMTALRDELLPARDHAHSVAASLADPDWADGIPRDRPTFVFADGLFAFLSEALVVGLFRSLPELFGTGELAFNDYARIGPLSRLAVKLAPQKMFNDVSTQWGYAGFKDAHQPESWNPKLRLIEETGLAGEPEVDLFPTWLRISTRICAHIPAMARKARILRYRF